jgi:hypothetical protein
LSSYDESFPTQVGVALFLDGTEESIQVEVQDFPGHNESLQMVCETRIVNTGSFYHTSRIAGLVKYNFQMIDFDAPPG